MARSARESYDEGQAAGFGGCLVVGYRFEPRPVGGRRAGTVVAGGGGGRRRGAGGPMGAGVAADRLTDALGMPLPTLAGPRSSPTSIRTRWLPSAAAGTCPPSSTGTCPSARPGRGAPRRPRYRLRPCGAPGLAGPGRLGGDYKRQGGVITFPLQSAEDIALLEMVRPSVDWRAVGTVAAGRRSPLAAVFGDRPGAGSGVSGGGGADRQGGPGGGGELAPPAPDFSAPVAGTDVHPQFDRRQVVAWLLARDKIEVPTGPTVASLVLAGTGGATHRFRLDYLWLSLAGEDQLSGWSTDAMAELAAREFGASCAAGPRRTAPDRAGPRRTAPDRAGPRRYRPVGGAGGSAGDRPVPVRVGRPAGDGGMAVRPGGAAAERLAAGVVRQGWAYAGPREGCVCTRHDCGGARGRGGPGDGVASRRRDPLRGVARG